MNIRFMSAQRGKKTRSAASRYRRYVRLTSTNSRTPLAVNQVPMQKKKKKSVGDGFLRVSEKTLPFATVQARNPSVGVRVRHTASPPLPSLTVGLRSLFATFRYERLRSTPKSSVEPPSAPPLHFAHALRATAACSLYQRPFSKVVHFG